MVSFNFATFNLLSAPHSWVYYGEPFWMGYMLYTLPPGIDHARYNRSTYAFSISPPGALKGFPAIALRMYFASRESIKKPFLYRKVGGKIMIVAIEFWMKYLFRYFFVLLLWGRYKMDQTYKTYLKFHTPNRARFRIWCGVNKIFWKNSEAISLNRYP